MKINILPSSIFNRIAAGEVVDKPASALKELIENSIDAGATQITVEIENGGIRKIAVTDNGIGIEPEDIKSAFLPHATSKIASVEDLDNIATLGFRGEALASIASVSQVVLISRNKSCEDGRRLCVDGGEFKEVTRVASPIGTYISINNLFYNTPARAKFLRRPKLEEAEITHLVERQMLAHPEIAFKYIVDGNEIYNTTSCKLSDIIYTIYGKDVYNGLIKIEASEGFFKLDGYITNPAVAKANRTYQTLFVNNRFVENFLFSSAVNKAYENYLMKSKFPVFVLNLSVPLDFVDVNVHPSKREVKFQNSGAIFAFVNREIEKALYNTSHVRSVSSDDEIIVPIKDTEIKEELSPFEGVSFKDKQDDQTDSNTQISSDKLKQKIEEKTDWPDFGSISNKDESEEKSPLRNGLIYFDQTGKNFIHEVEITAGKRQEDSKTLQQEIDLKEEINSFKVIGTLFKTYIIVESGENAYFIDQHAAHERQRFDKLKSDIEQNSNYAYDLLLPFILNVSTIEKGYIDKSIEALTKLGFKICEFGGNSYKVESVPMALADINLKAFFDDVLNEYNVWNKKTSDVLKDHLAQIACKGAVKAGDTLSDKEIKLLLSHINDGVMLCPHGRPIVIKVSKKELEKWFKRIV